ncbi:phosphoribosylglycinamide formyltransferase [Sediminibacillus massiliensis]|uniref:phosphoribosylglycinamide formyltransferase n=1 Tax=Sediminibacillus massiliensis TaxID=1926277 RepID=UPI00098887DF|nr:phosphoribosylglycinamide formyltransferase [Sediminibacillus massiliensis]
MKKKLAVFASGTGSNFEFIAKEITKGTVDGEIEILVCDKPGAEVIEKAESLSIPVWTFDAKLYPSKQSYETEILLKLREIGVEWIILAGYMRLVGPTLLSAFENRIVNIHPSLLPAFPGKDAIGQALDAGVKLTGVTIHFVDAGMDTGKIIEQEAVRIESQDDRLTLQKRIQAIEHELFPKTIQALLTSIPREEINS